WNTLCTTPACSNVCQGSYSVTVTDANGCSATATVSITEPASINISTTVTASNCSHADGSATASASGGVGTFSYQWLNGGPAAATWNNISGGTYIIVVTDQNNCADSSTVFVNNQPGVTASVSSITNVLCNGQSTGEIICTASNGAPAYTYVWSAPATGTTGTASNLPAGSYTLTVSDANGCATTVTAVVTEPPLLTVSAIATPTTVCSGSSVTVNGSATGGTPGYNYEWNPGNLNGATQTLAPVSTTTFIITATDANGCMATFNVPVNVNPVPVPVVLTNLNSGCAPLCVNFTDMSTVSAPGVITSWSWNYEAGTSSVQNPSYCFTSAGSYDVSLIVTTSDGCSDTVSFINYIGVYPDPVAGFSFQPVDSGGMSSQITFTDASTGAVSWLWNFGDDIGTSVQQHPAYNYPYAECYDATLTVTSAEGCMDTATMQVCIEADFVIYIPNAFTPNGDQLNDVFMPLGEGFDPAQFEIWIFNRWGNLIYHSTDMEKGWDGHMNGSSELCQVDTYAWRISVADLQGKTYNLLGKVALIR
ncbi:MAG TPA: PKD domain-containing protein, partial [Bacteroidia bacterium]|nr:PKD domain-containing protein [Bacteroidia bacterium]